MEGGTWGMAKIISITAPNSPGHSSGNCEMMKARLLFSPSSLFSRGCRGSGLRG